MPKTAQQLGDQSERRTCLPAHDRPERARCNAGRKRSRQSLLLSSALAASALLTDNAPVAAEFAGYATLTSDFVRRGVSQSDGHGAAQLGADLEFDGGFFAGVWGSTIDLGSARGHSRDLEVDYYAGYSAEAGDKFELTLMTVRYTYPGQTGSFDYDYQEYSAVANYDDRVWIEYIYAPDLFNTNRSAQIVEVYAQWPLNSRWSVGGGAGHYDSSKLTGRGYSYWQLGLTRSFLWADVDIRFHDTDRSVAYISTDERAEQRVALTIQVPFAF